MSAFGIAQRVYWRALRVRGLGWRLQAAVEDTKRLVRKTAAPVLDGVHETLQIHSSALAGLRDGLTAVRAEVGQALGVRADVRQALERALSAASADVERQLAALANRLDFVRQEALFELRAVTRGGAQVVAPGSLEIVNRAKFEAMSAAGPLRLNIGCGHITYEDYLNVDRRRLPGVDVVADVAELPFEPGTVAELYSSHLLEHFPLEIVRRVVLPSWLRMLRAGGTFRAIVPDAETMIAAYAKGEMSFDDLREVMFGLQEYEGDFHFAMYSRESLRALLAAAGLTDVGFAFNGRRNGKCFDMEIRGTKATA